MTSQPGASVPLRVKLIAAVLALVTIALLVIGVVSAIALRTSSIGRIERQLKDVASSIRIDLITVDQLSVGLPQMPSDYLVAYVRGNEAKMFVVRPQPGGAPLMPTAAQLRTLSKQYFTLRSQSTDERWRLLARPVQGTDTDYLVIGESLAGVDDAVNRLIVAELIVGIGVLVVLASVGVGIVQASLRPLTEIEHTAAAIAAGDLTRRVPEANQATEVGRLAAALNTMLAQIEGAFAARAASEERMRQFVADASHELRTPLTTIRGFAELYRQGAARQPEETAALLQRIESEAARMGLLVEDLLLLARLDRERPLTFAPVELRALASDAATAARAVAPDREIALVTGDESVLVLGDESRLRQVIGNLMTNALTHTPAGGPITARVRLEPGAAVLEVSDSGPGLTTEQRQRVFERFYRVDKARTKQAVGSAQAVVPHSGSGLGLAIVAALVAAHQGTVWVDSTPGSGATFSVRLPLVVPLADPPIRPFGGAPADPSAATVALPADPSGGAGAARPVAVTFAPAPVPAAAGDAMERGQAR
jgi:two-component system OmpR family sensor kinase